MSLSVHTPCLGPDPPSFYLHNLSCKHNLLVHVYRFSEAYLELNGDSGKVPMKAGLGHDLIEQHRDKASMHNPFIALHEGMKDADGVHLVPFLVIMEVKLKTLPVILAAYIAALIGLIVFYTHNLFLSGILISFLHIPFGSPSRITGIAYLIVIGEHCS